MNRQHLSAVLWLRACLLRNTLKRSGVVNTVLTALLLVLALLFSMAMFVVALVVGVWRLPQASPTDILLLWNGLIVAFLVMWLFGLFTQLQRSEELALEKLLHFPISLFGSFLVNYLSSFASLTLIVMLPPMIGLCIASVIAQGPSMLALFPLLAGFVFLITAVTYQFRGWLAVLMMNKRRRRMIMMLTTTVFIILTQLPTIWNMTVLRTRRDRRWTEAQRTVQRADKSRDADAHIRKHPIEAALDDFEDWLPYVDLALPPGWLAYGAMAAARSNVWPGLLGALGFCLISGASLRRSYRTTLRLYRGEQRSRRAPVGRAAPRPQKKLGVILLERNLPWISETASASALATYRSLMRAPEIKMALVTMTVFCVIFGVSIFVGRRAEIPEQFRPMLAMGIIMVETLSLAQIFLNQFGYDRDGFRAFVLCPSQRRQILLGKNLALAPVVLGLGCVTLLALQVVYPLGVSHFLATVIQMLSAYLMLSIVGNHCSILLPTAVRAGSMRASSTTAVTSLLRIVASMVLMTAISLLLIPFGIEVLLRQLNVGGAFPYYLLLAAALFVVVAFIYRGILGYQGALLQAREKKILEAVTTKSD